MGHLLGHAVRFGTAGDVMAAGEGIETMLSLRCVMPTMPMAAALSAAHLAAILFPPTLRRLYIVRDNDPAGDGAMARLIDRARTAGIEAIALSPRGDDFNDDLRRFGIDALRAALRVQLAPEDVARFLSARTRPLERGRDARRAGSRPIASRCVSWCVGEEPRPRPSERAIGGKRPGPAMASRRLFSVALAQCARRFTSRNKIAGCRHPPLRFGRCRFARRCRSGPPAAFRRHEGRDGRGRSDERKSP